MRFFTARSVALATLVPALLLFAFVPGCAKQSEGERCGDDEYGADDEDCGEGLVCKGRLLDSSTTRCCYSNGQVSDSRCEPEDTTSIPVAGAGGGGAGSSVEAGAGSGG